MGDNSQASLPAGLQRLWQLAVREGVKTGLEPDNVFGEIGLFLDYPPRFNDPNPCYDCTPINSSTFAGTGGDGVHFGLLHLDDRLSDGSPVVMTVPTNYGCEKNWILGADLMEFLALGCQVGFFALEKIAYIRTRRGEPQKRYRIQFRDFEPVDLKHQPALKRIATEFDLKPWEELERRLDNLESDFHGLIRVKGTE